MVTSASRGTLVGASVCSRSTPHAAMSSPATPPRAPSRTLSVSICRMSRARPAPRAPRIASSFCREAARVNSRLATLAQAISNTKQTAPSKISRGRVTSPTISSCIGTSRTPSPSFAGYWRSSRAAIPSMSDCAVPRVTPARKRPMIVSQNVPRDCIICANRSEGASGVQSSACSG